MVLILIDGATFRLAIKGGTESSEVGFGIGSVKMGTEVACPTLSRMEWRKPGAGLFVLARIWTVPDGAKLVMTLTGEVRTSRDGGSFEPRFAHGREEGTARWVCWLGLWRLSFPEDVREAATCNDVSRMNTNLHICPIVAIQHVQDF
jgi:hypothetical protein